MLEGKFEDQLEKAMLRPTVTDLNFRRGPGYFPNALDSSRALATWLTRWAQLI